jgi:hypothetical protein
VGWGVQAKRLITNRTGRKRDIVYSPQFMRFLRCHVSVLISEPIYKVNPSHEFFSKRVLPTS